MAKKPPSSIWSRSLKLAKAATQVASQEISHRVSGQFSGTVQRDLKRKLTQVEQAKIMTESLSQLKGAAMKAGQMLSIEASDILPNEVVQILRQLQKDSEPMSFDIIQDILKTELGEEKFQRLEGLSSTPVASASIGQVHKARIDGQPVAIKVQYPGIDQSIHSDIKILKTMTQSFLKMTQRSIPLDEVFTEFAEVLEQEVNYTLEAQSMQKYGAFLSEHIEWEAPKPLLDFSSSHVLTMSWQNGLTLNDWLKTNPNKEDRLWLAHNVLGLFIQEFFHWGFVQTDPNFANFLIQTKPLKLVLIDFGATKEYGEDFRRDYRHLLRAFYRGSSKEILELAYANDLLSPKESSEAQKAFLEMMELSVAPFRSENQPFDFSDKQYAQDSREVAQNFVKQLKFSPPPQKILFLHRKLGGIFHLVKDLGVAIDLQPYWIDIAQEDSSGA